MSADYDQRNHQFAIEQDQKAKAVYFEQHGSAITQTLRGIGLLNGGGVISMLGLLQALAPAEKLHVLVVMKPYALWAGALFLIGAALPLLATWARSIQLTQEYLRNKKSPWRALVTTMIASSFVAFAGASLVAGTGLWRAF